MPKSKMPLMDKALLKALGHPTRQAILKEMVTPHCPECGGTKNDPQLVPAEGGDPCHNPWHDTAKIVLKPMSPNMLSSQMDEPLGNVSYHIKTLLEHGAVELVKTEPRRGAVEHFYLPTGNFRKQLAALASVGPEVGMEYEEAVLHA